MRCTNFSDVLKQLKDIEVAELKAAVAAHGGTYRFDEDDDHVTITFDTADSLEGASDVEVVGVSIREDGSLAVIGIPRDEFDEVEFDADAAASGNLQFVTEAIPGTDGVDDVTIPATVTIGGTVAPADIQTPGQETATVKPSASDRARSTLQGIRIEAAGRIRRVLEEAGLDTVYASDVNPGNSPVVETDSYDDNNTKTLDSVRITDEGLVFAASSCCDDIEHYEDTISTDALLDIADWLEKYADNIGQEED